MVTKKTPANQNVFPGTLEQHLREAQDCLRTGELAKAQSAFSQLEKKTHPLLSEWAIRRPVPGCETEDLVQSTYANAWAGLMTFDPQKPVIPWLSAVMRNAATDLYRQHARQPFVSALDNTLDQFPSRYQRQSAELMDLPVYLSELSDKERDAVVCRYFKGFQVDETAEAMGIPMGSVGGTVRRALLKMRACCEQ